MQDFARGQLLCQKLPLALSPKSSWMVRQGKFASQKHANKCFFVMNDENLSIQRSTEGVQGAIGKPPGINFKEKKQVTPKEACPKGCRGRPESPLQNLS